MQSLTNIATILILQTILGNYKACSWATQPFLAFATNSSNSLIFQVNLHESSQLSFLAISASLRSVYTFINTIVYFKFFIVVPIVLGQHQLFALSRQMYVHKYILYLN